MTDKNWSIEDEKYLEKLHQECNVLIEAYRKEYLNKNHQLCYYRIPTIVISSISGFLAIGNTGYINKENEKYISLLVGTLNLFTSIINIIENFKQISSKVNLSNHLYHELLQLSNDIGLTLSIPKQERNYKSGIEAITKYYEKYSGLMKEASILNNQYENYLELKIKSYDKENNISSNIINET